jgi:hypothetical protein
VLSVLVLEDLGDGVYLRSIAVLLLGQGFLGRCASIGIALGTV